MSPPALRSLVSSSSFGSLRSAMRGRYRVPRASSPLSTEPGNETVTNFFTGKTNTQLVYIYVLPCLFVFGLGNVAVLTRRRELELGAALLPRLVGNADGVKAEGMIQSRE